MSRDAANPFESLGRLFHEPNRLALVTALAAEPGGIAFMDLKETLGLTDGNLSRHLKTLEEAEAIEIEKTFVDLKPRTTVFLTDSGRMRFLDYLNALGGALRQAERSVQAGAKGGPDPLRGKPVRA